MEKAIMMAQQSFFVTRRDREEVDYGTKSAYLLPLLIPSAILAGVFAVTTAVMLPISLFMGWL